MLRRGMLVISLILVIGLLTGSAFNRQKPLQPRRRSFTTSDFDLLDQILRSEERAAEDHELDQLLNRPDYYRLAIIDPPELSLCKKMFEGLLVERRGTVITEFCSDEDDQRQFEVNMHGKVLRIREVRQPEDGLNINADIVLLLIEGKSEESVLKAIEDINLIRSINENTAIGVMVINDGKYPGLQRILSEAFDERCMAFVFNGLMDPDAAWYTILELVHMFESDRSGSENTRMLSTKEPESSWYDVFSSWSTYFIPSKLQEQCTIQ